ncbi:PfkB family carbohydrate kinase [Pediococcus claussenii]|uniref:pyridoxal kinase n=1 Tax=Pediococcus claussenii (strain ATCC BAA-344 / DSM 14800 / JCM 18046 / KCTC 3811 / LMG 21948 / P06) TaxID=701521 RepID=G8PAY2_PEDCP|nr:PfkB family carbohydrate kinase [Pediococcus claussenii]AEV95850.1 pfkB carbohydrate kinase family protein [Pediococcus claussenii ATCC BAA-344]ANZ69346.1 hypothetical protein AYR57_03075 [Pediococcus claussenii]ANZ71166.1 hypothetical protein AYR58_03090 [Pediococcus claussenii]KRN20457.1 hypothetical protein IV79_GL000512 [Pediococcus claussenii]
MAHVEQNQEKKVIVAEDLSSLGSISMGIALPILATFGFTVVPVPTMLLSAQTEGFGKPEILDLHCWWKNSVQSWNKLGNLKLNAGLLGYLGSVEMIKVMQEFLDRDLVGMVVLDPAMADSGKLYAGFDANYVDAMRGLLGKANIVTPNITEAQLLADIKVGHYPTNDELIQLFDALQTVMKPNSQLIITGVHDTETISTVWLVNGHVKRFEQPKVTGHFDGTGDLFAAVLTGCLASNSLLEKSIEVASKVVRSTILKTSRKDQSSHYGLNVGCAINELQKQIEGLGENLE